MNSIKFKNLLNIFIVTVVCIPFTRLMAEETKYERIVWDNPLKVSYRNMDYSYELLIKSIECLVERPTLSATTLSQSCMKHELNEGALLGRQDGDRNAYERQIFDGLPKEGPYTRIRVIRVGGSKSLLQIESTRWNIILPSRRVSNIEHSRFEEILKNLSYSKN